MEITNLPQLMDELKGHGFQEDDPENWTFGRVFYKIFTLAVPKPRLFYVWVRVDTTGDTCFLRLSANFKGEDKPYLYVHCGDSQFLNQALCYFNTEFQQIVKNKHLPTKMINQDFF